VSLPRAPDAGGVRERRLTIARRIAVATWAAVVIYRTVTTGFAFNRELLLLYICTGLLAASIGQGRRMLYVIRDWLPFAMVLVAYDLSRGAATLIGRPTLWHWQIDMDRWMFFGTVPTVWLQEKLKLPYPPWWEIVMSTVYMSFFVLPYVVAAVLWLRDREEWKAFVRLFVGLSFAALIVYALLPAAPPWAAARCTPADVASGPSDPRCMFRPAFGVPDGGLLGTMQTAQDGSNGWVERITTRGWGKLNLHSAGALIDQGQASVNLVAAIPSLHAALTAAVAAFLWARVHRKWRPLLVAYVLVMAFTLVYTAEHYVVDVLLGWVLAAVVVVVISRFESRRAGPAPEKAQVQLSTSPHS
jgi:membrane-associated phospholipid phosphatase